MNKTAYEPHETLSKNLPQFLIKSKILTFFVYNLISVPKNMQIFLELPQHHKKENVGDYRLWTWEPLKDQHPDDGTNQFLAKL